jgi:hypothetical protein
MMPSENRRLEVRTPSRVNGVVLATGLEVACVIADRSASGMRVRLERNLSLPAQVTVIDVSQATAHDMDVIWRKGQEAGLKQRSQSSLKGLIPSRLTAARAALLRAGGR